jgi:hypothetical protein
MGKTRSNSRASSSSKSKTFKSHSSYKIPLKSIPDPTQERVVRLITSKLNTIREAERSIIEAERAAKKALRAAKKAESDAKKAARMQIIPERTSSRKMKSASYYNPEKEASRQREMERTQREINNARKEAKQQVNEQADEMTNMFSNFGMGKGNKSKRFRRKRGTIKNNMR